MIQKFSWSIKIFKKKKEIKFSDFLFFFPKDNYEGDDS